LIGCRPIGSTRGQTAGGSSSCCGKAGNLRQQIERGLDGLDGSDKAEPCRRLGIAGNADPELRPVRCCHGPQPDVGCKRVEIDPASAID
jgi:hypothetical protein